MLHTAKVLEDRRGYVLAKLFATTGLSVSDLPLVTVEAAETGRLVKGREIVRFSAGLQTDLLAYAKQNGRLTGASFTQKNGAPLLRPQAYERQLEVEEVSAGW